MARDRVVAAMAVALVFLLWWCSCFHAATALMLLPDDLVDGSRPHRFLPTHPVGTAIAVDLGNTNSCVAGYHNDTAVFLLCIPTSVAFADDGAALVGEAAKNHADAISGFDRLLGREFDDEIVLRAAEQLPYKIVGDCSDALIEVKVADRGAMHASDVASMVVAELKARAEEYLGRKVHNAVLTVPYHFSDGPRGSAMYAARFAGLKTFRVLDELTAAAIYHGVHRRLRDNGRVLVLHVGGGTSEATILIYGNGVLEGLGSWRDFFLGGDDMDRKIADHFVQLIKDDHGIDIGDDKAAVSQLRAECERAKKALSSHDVAPVNLGPVQLSNGAAFSFSGSLTRAQFEELIHDLFQRIMALVESTVEAGERSGLLDMIDEVVLAGGSTRIPRIRQLVKEYLGGRKKMTNVSYMVEEPDEAAVHGGALLSHPTADGYACMGRHDRFQRGLPTDYCYGDGD